MSKAVVENSSASNSRRSRKVRRWLSLIMLTFACAGFALTLLFDSRNSSASTTENADNPARAELEVVEPQETGGGDFSKFAHTNAMHARLPCLLCHRRETNSPQVKLPGHTPCAGCHTQQFNNSGSPICAICHTDVQSGAVKPFPSLRSFNVMFDHSRHVGAGQSRAACATCHKTDRRGVALSIPAGLNAHATCFQCHAPRAQSNGRDISSCGTCHSLGGFSRTPTWARAYRVNFSHTDHVQRRGLSCAECHNIRAGASQGRQVTAPAPEMHHLSARAMNCASCHNDKRAFGIANFANCKKCHEGTSFRF